MTFIMFLRWKWCGDLRELRMNILLIFIFCLISGKEMNLNNNDPHAERFYLDVHTFGPFVSLQ